MHWKKVFAFIAAIALISLPACGRKATPTPLATLMALQTATDTVQAATTPPPTTKPSITPSATGLTRTPKIRKTMMPGTGTPTAVTVSVSTNTDCRSGPGPVYQLVGTLKVGKMAKVVGMEADGKYWIINNPDVHGGTCCISGQYAKVKGIAYYDLPVFAAPPTPTPTLTPTIRTPAAGVVWNISITIAYSMIHTPDCTVSGTFTQISTVTITTSGAATVTYHLEDSVQGAFPAQTMIFPDAGTESDKIGFDVVTQPCGDHDVKVVVTSPNSLTSSTSFQVVTP